jgi:hypothetical protein
METHHASPAAENSVNRGNPWTMPLVLLVALAITGALLVKFRHDAPSDAGAEPGGSQSGWSAAIDPQSELVSLAIDFGNGARREFRVLPWTAGMTVADLLESAAEFRPGIRYSRQGALLTSIDGVSNGSPADRFWLYEVNGQMGKVSFAEQPLAAGDEVLWAFKPPE